MKFGQLATTEGLILAHTLRLSSGEVFKKGRRLSALDVKTLCADGLQTVWAAQLEPEDWDEDEAASALAESVRGEGVRRADAATGRCNLFAEHSGLLAIDAERVRALNRLSPALTLATLPLHSVVRRDDMLATIKIIPFAVPGALLRQADALARASLAATERLIRVLPFEARRMGLILTMTKGLPDSMLDRAAAAQRVRADRLGSVVSDEIRTAHTESAIASALASLCAAGCDPVLILGASAIVDRRDVIPSAIEQLGGTVIHLGMPVDPGNLLLIGRVGRTRVLGVPGCARSLRRSGFDFVLERLCAGLDVTADDVMDLGRRAPSTPCSARARTRCGRAVRRVSSCTTTARPGLRRQVVRRKTSTRSSATVRLTCGPWARAASSCTGAAARRGARSCRRRRRPCPASGAAVPVTCGPSVSSA